MLVQLYDGQFSQTDSRQPGRLINGSFSAYETVLQFFAEGKKKKQDKRTVVFDVKFTSGSDSMINFLLRKYWFGAHYGNDYFTVYADGTTSDASVKTEFVDGGWMRIKINLASAPQAGNPEYVSKIEWTAATTGSGLIKYMGYED